ncbi:MAG: sugar phosphate isomerase/epimerase [Verrucomicrobiae bacterium]|nr:sugar phosphate isomerase/epimerase [Verrucomicrobiae bacterium]
MDSPHTSRRRFLAAGLAAGTLMSRACGDASGQRRFTLDLTPGAIGVSGTLPDIIRLAEAHGFESVQPDAGWLVLQDAEGRRRVTEALVRAELRWGSANLPVDFRGSDDVFERDVAALPAVAAALQSVGATRIGTWISPGHNELSHADNMERHARRLRQTAQVLSDYGIRLGLEYVGTPSLRARFRHSFIHNLSGTRELIGAIGVPGTGVILDSWHWWTSGDTENSIRRLTNRDLVAVDLNDAPAGVPLAELQDNRRELPAATGVIPVKVFLEALVAVDYDGPVRAEPFNAALNALDNEAAAAATIVAIRRAVALA